MTFEVWFAARQIPVAGAAAVLRLAEGGVTVPFIARHRKEQTGALEEMAIRAVIDGKESWDDVVKQQIALSMKSGAEVARGHDEKSGTPRDNHRGSRPQSPRAPVPPPRPDRPFNSPFAGLEKLRGK